MNPGWGIALLRVSLGSVFLVHGLAGLFVGPGAAGLAAELAARGFPAPGTLAWTALAIELLGGLALFVGWLVRWVAGVLFVEVLVVRFTSKLANGFLLDPAAGEWGYEYELVLLAGLAALVLTGAGKLALDDWLLRRRAAGLVA